MIINKLFFLQRNICLKHIFLNKNCIYNFRFYPIFQYKEFFKGVCADDMLFES